MGRRTPGPERAVGQREHEGDEDEDPRGSVNAPSTREQEQASRAEHQREYPPGGREDQFADSALGRDNGDERKTGDEERRHPLRPRAPDHRLVLSDTDPAPGPLDSPEQCRLTCHDWTELIPPGSRQAGRPPVHLSPATETMAPRSVMAESQDVEFEEILSELERAIDAAMRRAFTRLAELERRHAPGGPLAGELPVPEG